MALNTKILRGSAVLTVNEIVSNLCSFVRSYILARVLSKGDFGIAATLTVTFLFLELISKMAFGQQIVTSKYGGDPRFVDTGHTVQLVLGLFSAVLFLLLAKPLAIFVGVPELTNGMRLLALVPACMALSSLAAFTYAREMHFERSVSLEIVPQLLITLAAYPVAIWLQDFRAFIWLQIGKAALSTLVSYFVAGRRYTFDFKMEYCREIFRYSWPLMVSGFIMLCSTQGDRLLMTKGYDLQDLGAYAVAWLLAATPSFALLKVIGGTALPLMGKAAGNPELMRSRYAMVSQLFALCGALFAIGFVIAGEQTIVLVYGAKYAGTGLIAALMACGHGVRIIRGAPTGVAWGSGETTTQMVGNLVRVSGLLLVIPIVLLKLPLYWVAAAGFAGEVFALLAAVIGVHRVHRMSAGICFNPTLVAAGCVALSAVIAHWFFPARNLVITAVLVLVMYALTFAMFAKLFPEIGDQMGKVRAAVGSRLARFAQVA